MFCCFCSDFYRNFRIYECFDFLFIWIIIVYFVRCSFSCVCVSDIVDQWICWELRDERFFDVDVVLGENDGCFFGCDGGGDDVCDGWRDVGDVFGCDEDVVEGRNVVF